MKSIGVKKKIFLSFILILTVILSFFYIPKFFGEYEDGVEKLTDWNYIDENGDEKKISLPQKLYKDENGVIEIYTTIPQDISAHRCICFFTFYQSVQVYVDDKAMYVYDNSNIDSFGEASSSTWNFAEIKDPDAAGKQLKIRMQTPYDDINLRLTEVVYGDIEDVHCWLENTYGVFYFLDCAFIWFGIFFVLLAFIQKVQKQYRKYQFYGGLLFILFSIYLRTGTKALPIYWMNNFVREFLCFFSLLFLALPLILYIRAKVEHHPRMVLWCDILAGLELVTTTVLFLLHGVGVLDLHRSMAVGLIILFMSIVTGFVYSLYILIKEHSKPSVFSLISILLILAVLILEYLQFYQMNTLPFDTGFISRMAAVLVAFVEASLYIYYFIINSKKREKVHAENQSLQIQLMTSQIRPHFIINTIGAIRALIKENPDLASDLLCDFSKYIRSNLEQRDFTKPVPFFEEMDYINTYLKLEKARYGDNIRVEYDIQTVNFRVLPLTIQPFVENAVKHGLSPSRTDGSVLISTKMNKDSVLIEIVDNGSGFEMSEIDKKLNDKRSMGMKSAMMRLKNEMGANVSIRSNTNPKHSGTWVRIEIPCEERKHK